MKRKRPGGNDRPDVTNKAIILALQKIGSLRGAAKYLRCSCGLIERRAKNFQSVGKAMNQRCNSRGPKRRVY